MAWMRQAECAGEEPELFFPVGSTGPALDQMRRAKAICARCPVRAECLEWAIASGIDHGVWGGTTEEERRSLRRSRRRAEIALL
jgi:WhiB family redox-sensing transcriptional regulator